MGAYEIRALNATTRSLTRHLGSPLQERATAPILQFRSPSTAECPLRRDSKCKIADKGRLGLVDHGVVVPELVQCEHFVTHHNSMIDEAVRLTNGRFA
ncbi:hypothetical protein [Micromonospora chokoriensis]|uniref:hypothetical protein n=1 Tax=Micromonospora chokoriensis TaxID=356851 RepID=UPI0004C456C5|nr:hypothetical protein [Micromonospora chokoriensis]